MTRPENLFEAASYDLNKFRERRVAERRATPRGTPDRRMQHNGTQVSGPAAPLQEDIGKSPDGQA